MRYCCCCMFWLAAVGEEDTTGSEVEVAGRCSCIGACLSLDGAVAGDSPAADGLSTATTLTAVAEPGQHLAMSVEDIVAASGGVAAPGPGEDQQHPSPPPSVDALDWYAQRATIGSVYVAAELFFLTDYSEDHSDTWCACD